MIAALGQRSINATPSKENSMVKWISVAIVVMVMAATVSFQVSAQQNQMSFFVTSAGSGNGANLGLSLIHI